MIAVWIGLWLALLSGPALTPPDQPAEIEARLAKGQEYLAEKKFQKALIEFSEILKTEREHFEANLGRARALIGLGDSRKALDPARLATDLKPDSVRAWRLLGDAYAHPGTQDYPRASRAYRKVLKLEPASLEAAMSLARALSYMKEVEQAIGVLENARKHHPDELKLLTKLAESYYAIRKLDKAEELINQVLEKEPGHPEAKRVLEQIRGRRAYNLWVPIVAIVAFPLIIILVRRMKKGREVKV
jgi:tetratricopeptide (TPR) repeat protein